MKTEFHARIVGHELFTPDKENLKRQGVRVKLQVASMQPALGKPTKAVLPIDYDELGDFPIGRFLRITVVETQQEIDFASPAAPRKAKNGELGIVPPATEGAAARRRGKSTDTPLH